MHQYVWDGRASILMVSPALRAFQWQVNIPVSCLFRNLEIFHRALSQHLTPTRSLKNSLPDSDSFWDTDTDKFLFSRILFICSVWGRWLPSKNFLKTTEFCLVIVVFACFVAFCLVDLVGFLFFVCCIWKLFVPGKF